MISYPPLVDRPADQYTNPATAADIEWLHKSICAFHFGKGTCSVERRIRAAFDRERNIGVDLGLALAGRDRVVEKAAAHGAAA